MPRTLRRNPVPARIRSTRKNPVIDLSEFDATKGYDAVQGAVFRYAPETIWYKDDFDARDDRALTILAKHDIDAEHTPLGEGAMARVYALAGDPDWVVKVTSDPTDAALMAEAQFAGPFAGTPGIPKVASVFDLGPHPTNPTWFPGHTYAVVIERLSPLDRVDKLAARALSKKFRRGWLASPEEAQKALKKAKPGSVEEAWLRGVLFIYAMGFRPTDLHADNIMQRGDGTYAFSDFGVSGVEGRTASRDIPALTAPAPRKKRVRKPAQRMTPPPGGIATRPMPKRKNPDLRASVTANLRPDTVAVVAFWSPKDNNWLRKQFSDMASARAFFAKAEQAPAARYVPSQFYVVGEE